MNKHLQLRTLAAATAVVLSSISVSAFAVERLNLSGLQDAQTHQRFIVKYRDGTPEAASTSAVGSSLMSAARAVPASRGRALATSHVRRLAVGADVIETSRTLDSVEAESLMRQIAADPNVEYVEVDTHMVAYATPNDPRFAEQYGFGTGPGGIRAAQAWDSSKGEGVVVAVLDTGYTEHSDLLPNILPGYDFVSNVTMANDGDGRDADARDPGDNVSANFCQQFGSPPHGATASSWHGTHVAGTVAAITDNGKGVAGTAPDAKIVPVRVLGRCGGSSSDISDGIVWASGGSVQGVPANANPAEVLNMSLGSRDPATCNNTTRLAIEQAVARGSIVVVAAGNSNGDASSYTMTNCGNVISVGSVTNTGERSWFSNHGASVHIAAPGSDILSTYNSGASSPAGESYASNSGTSMAAPHVAGVVALVQSAATTPLTQPEMITLLRDTATRFPSTPSRPIGAGIVNAAAAVEAVLGDTTPNPDPDPDPTPVDGELANGVPVTGISGQAGSAQYWTVAVPTGATNLRIVLAGGTGFVSSADLYVLRGAQPTTTQFNCRLTGSPSPKTCQGATPQPGTYHILVRGGGFLPFSGATLTASYN